MSKGKKKKLSEDDTSKLIEIVKEHPCLWNPSDSDYHDRHTISQTWEKISTIMGLPANFLKAKWKNVRDMYIKIIRKYKTREAYTGHWKYFEPLNYIYRPYSEESGDSEDNVDSETLYDEDTPLSEVSIKLEQEPLSSEDDPIVPAPRKRRKDSADESADYDLLFLKSLVPYFKKLDTMRKLVVRSRIQDMLMNELAAQRTEGFKRLMGDI